LDHPAAIVPEITNNRIYLNQRYLHLQYRLFAVKGVAEKRTTGPDISREISGLKPLPSRLWWLRCFLSL